MPYHQFKPMADHVFGLALERFEFRKHRGFGGREQAVEPTQDGERQNDLSVLVPLVRSPKQITYAPDEIGQLGMGFNGHGVRRTGWRSQSNCKMNIAPGRAE